MSNKRSNRYDQIIVTLFERHFVPGQNSFEFEREILIEIAEQLGLARPRNIGDILYTYRYRRDMPQMIVDTAPAGYQWVIQPAGIGRYRFALVKELFIVPSSHYAHTKIPDATPGVIRQYAMSDEQALLAILRYNRLIDIFTGLACYSLQNHLRTTAQDVGQVEIDELYIGLDRRGAHYILPVQAKGSKDRIGPIQIEQDLAVCAQKFPDLICRPIAAQFMDENVIVLFEFESAEDGIRISAEKHYLLVEPGALTSEDLAAYRQRQM